MGIIRRLRPVQIVSSDHIHIFSLPSGTEQILLAPNRNCSLHKCAVAAISLVLSRCIVDLYCVYWFFDIYFKLH